MGIEEKLKDFRTGWATIRDFVGDYIKYSKNLDTTYPLNYHENKIDSLKDNKWKVLGSYAAIGINFIKHPKATNTLLFGNPVKHE